MKSFKYVTQIATTLLMVQALTACGELEDIRGTNKRIKISSSSTSEELSLAGEELLAHQSLFHADRVFAQALSADPNNARALFYKDVLRPVMTLKGLAGRIQGKARQDLQVDLLLDSSEDLSIKDFVMMKSKGSKVSNAKEAQDLLVEIRNAFIESSRGFKKRMGASFELKLNPITLTEIAAEGDQISCSEAMTEENGVTVYEYVCDSQTKSSAQSYTMTGPDMLFMHQYYGGAALYLNSYTSYSLEGYEKVAAQLDRDENLGVMETHQLVSQERNFLTLRKDNNLKFFKEMGASLVSAIKWAQTHQDRFCSYPENFEKSYLKALCFDQQAVANVGQAQEVLQTILKGSLALEVRNGQAEVFNIRTLWEKPIRDLKVTFAPKAVSECGMVSFVDPTFGGILPEGNIIKAAQDCSNE